MCGCVETCQLFDYVFIIMIYAFKIVFNDYYSNTRIIVFFYVHTNQALDK